MCAPQHQRLDASQIFGRQRRQRPTKLQPYQGQRRHAAARPELGGCPSYVRAPGGNTIRIAFVARGVPGAIEVEAKDGKPGARERLSQMAKGAMRPDQVVSDWVAKHNPKPANA